MILVAVLQKLHYVAVVTWSGPGSENRDFPSNAGIRKLGRPTDKNFSAFGANMLAANLLQWQKQILTRQKQAEFSETLSHKTIKSTFTL